MPEKIQKVFNGTTTSLSAIGIFVVLLLSELGVIGAPTTLTIPPEMTAFFITVQKDHETQKELLSFNRACIEKTKDKTDDMLRVVKSTLEEIKEIRREQKP